MKLFSSGALMSTERNQLSRIKSKYVESEYSPSGISQDITPPALLIVSTEFRRISFIINRIFEKTGKFLECHGVELYRQAYSRLQTDLADRVVALIITDQPVDHSSLSINKCPLWKTVIKAYQQNYVQSFSLEIEREIYPSALTVITMFQSFKGKMSEEDIKQIESEFDTFQKQNEIKHHDCNNEEEIKHFVDKELIGTVIDTHRKKKSIRSLEKRRTQRLVRTQNITKEAWRKRYD